MMDTFNLKTVKFTEKIRQTQENFICKKRKRRRRKKQIPEKPFKSQSHSMIEFYEEEANRFKKELERLKEMRKTKEIRQAVLRKNIVEITRANETLKKLLRKNEYQQEIEVLDRQIIYLNERIEQFFLQKQRFLRLIENEQERLNNI